MNDDMLEQLARELNEIKQGNTQPPAAGTQRTCAFPPEWAVRNLKAAGFSEATAIHTALQIAAHDPQLGRNLYALAAGWTPTTPQARLEMSQAIMRADQRFLHDAA